MESYDQADYGKHCLLEVPCKKKKKKNFPVKRGERKSGKVHHVEEDFKGSKGRHYLPSSLSRGVDRYQEREPDTIPLQSIQSQLRQNFPLLPKGSLVRKEELEVATQKQQTTCAAQPRS